MTEITLNKDTPWQFKFDDDIKLGSYVRRTYGRGKWRGIWKVEQLNQIVVDSQNQPELSRSRWDGSGYRKHTPPIGMCISISLKLRRVMDEFYGAPYRRDSTNATIQQCELVTPEKVKEVKDEYEQRVKNLDSLMAGTWAP